MARAYRHFIPGYIWHLTHRCHKQEFLFRFFQDRSRWIQLLYEARKRYGLSIRTGQEYNQRKKRKGAFWQDRYHATAIEPGDHLWQCLVYVDLNMIRAGVAV